MKTKASLLLSCVGAGLMFSAAQAHAQAAPPASPESSLAEPGAATELPPTPGSGPQPSAPTSTAQTVPTSGVDAQPSAPSSSAQPSGSGIAEVVVTARRRAENAQRVPITVDALSATQLVSQNVTTDNDLSRVAPGLSIMNTSANRETVTYSIRGQGSTFGSGPGVIPYFNDVANFGNQSIYDLANVQVLKGPQGTLFGRNTTGGAVLFSPQMPTDQFTGYIDTRLGNYSRHDLEGAIGGPILGDKLMFRISGQSLNRDGYTTYALDGSKLDDENSQSVRGILTFQPVKDFQSVTLVQASGNHSHGDGAVFENYSMDPAINAFGAAFSPQLAQQLAQQKGLGVRTVLGDFPNHFDLMDVFGVINTTEWRLSDFFTLKNIASYQSTRTGRDWDLDGTNLPILGVLNPISRSKQDTEEIQGQFHLGPATAQAGFYYEHVSNPFQYAFGEELLTATVATAESSHNTSQGGYIQADYRILPQLNITAGARYTVDSLYQGGTGTAFLAPGTPLPSLSDDPFTPPGGSITDPVHSVFHAVTWNFAADYSVDRDLNVYAHVSRGFKEGGFNGTAPPLFQEYEPEYVIDYEGGIKGQGSIGNWRIRYDVDGFYDDYSNIQRDQNIIYNSQALTVIENAAAGYITGAEGQFTIVPTDFLQLTAGYTYLYAKYRRYEDPEAGDISASRFPNLPTNQFTLTPLIKLPIPPSAGALSVQSNIYYQSSFATDAFNVANGNPLVDLDVPGANAPGYTRVDFRVDWSNVFRTHIDASFYALNAFNKKYVTGTDNQLNDAISTETALYGAPAFYGVELRYSFGGH